MSSTVPWSIFPRRLEGEQPSGLHFNRHVGELKGNPLEFADLLAELRTVDCPLLGVRKRALGTADAGRRDLKPRSAEPLVGDVEAFVNLAEHGGGGNAAVGKFEDAIVVPAVRHIAVALAHGEPRMSLVDEERGDQLLAAARCVLFARCGEQDHEIGNVGMADEMLGAVNDEIGAILPGRAFHAAHVRAGAGLRHGEAVGLVAAHGGKQIALALLSHAGHENIGRSRYAVPVERIIGAAELLFVENPAERIKTGTAHLCRHIGSIEAGGNCLLLEFLAQVLAQLAGAFDLRLMGKKLVLHEAPRRLDDHPLLFGEGEIHNIHPRW